MRAIQVINPQGMPPRDWCDRMALELDQFGTIPILLDGMTWKDWAREVIQLSEISRFDPPNPDQYPDEDFEDWAADFSESVSDSVTP